MLALTLFILPFVGSLVVASVRYERKREVEQGKRRPNFDEDKELGSWAAALSIADGVAIGYSFRFYCTGLMRGFDVKLLAIDGVAPTVENIENGTYPLASCFYAVTRADADENTLALLEWITGPQGQELVEKAGYTPLAAGGD